MGRATVFWVSDFDDFRVQAGIAFKVFGPMGASPGHVRRLSAARHGEVVAWRCTLPGRWPPEPIVGLPHVPSHLPPRPTAPPGVFVCLPCLVSALNVSLLRHREAWHEAHRDMGWVKDEAWEVGVDKCRIRLSKCCATPIANEICSGRAKESIAQDWAYARLTSVRCTHMPGLPL